MLWEVAEIVREQLVGTTAAPVRYGGDEYAVILPQTGMDEAADYAERIRASIADTVFLKKSMRPEDDPIELSDVITASVGVASLSMSGPPTGNSRVQAEALLRAADNAMYRAKELGKNRVQIAK